MSLIEAMVREAEQLEISGRPDDAARRWEEALGIERRPLVLARLGRLWTLSWLPFQVVTAE